MVKFLRNKNFNNKQSKRLLPIDGISCWAVNSEDVNSFKKLYNEVEFEEVKFDSSFEVLALDFERVDNFATFDFRGDFEWAVELWSEIEIVSFDEKHCISISSEPFVNCFDPDDFIPSEMVINCDSPFQILAVKKEELEKWNSLSDCDKEEIMKEKEID